MPRPRRPTAGPIQRRVRTGCKTCRQRKVKCDEAKPSCRNCTARGLACDSAVQLKWEQEFVSRGLAFGRQGRWAKQPRSPSSSSSFSATSPSAEHAAWCAIPHVRAHHFVNTLFCEYDRAVRHEQGWMPDDSQALVPLTLPSRPLVDFSPPPSPPYLSCSYTPSLLSLSRTDASLLDYYLGRLCPLTTPSRLRPSPFASLLVPVLHVSGHDDILKAVLALSARHRSVTDSASSSRWSKTAMTLRDGVLGSLRRRLEKVAAADSDEEHPWDAQILVLMMFLCLYEIVDSCDHRWVIHLRASQDVIRRSRTIAAARRCPDGFDSLTAFTERFFAFQDVISRAACENAPLFGQAYWDRQPPSSPQSSDLDAWMGCSPALAQALCRITDLARLRAREAISADDFAAEAAALEQDLDGLAHPGDPDGHDTFLARAAELKRQAVVLYRACVLDGAGPATPRVPERVAQLLEATATLVDQGLTAGLSFPLFVAAVELDPLDQQRFPRKDGGGGGASAFVSGRRLVLETLATMGRASLANVARTQAVIETVWRMRDMALDSGHGDAPGTSSSDWGVFVGPYSANISLA